MTVYHSLTDFEQMSYYAGFSKGFYGGAFTMFVIIAIIFCNEKRR